VTAAFLCRTTEERHTAPAHSLPQLRILLDGNAGANKDKSLNRDLYGKVSKHMSAAAALLRMCSDPAFTRNARAQLEQATVAAYRCIGQSALANKIGVLALKWVPWVAGGQPCGDERLRWPTPPHPTPPHPTLPKTARLHKTARR
jgi:hypothetical protein